MRLTTGSEYDAGAGRAPSGEGGLVCVTKNFLGQTPSGGYDQLARFLGARTVARRRIESLPMHVLEKAWHFAFGEKRHLFSHLGHGYRFEDRMTEERVFWQGIVSRPEIIHVLYGDWMLDTLLRRKALLRSRLVASFHLPAQQVTDRFERAQKRELAALDGAILLASCDLPAYAGWLGAEKVTVIPHGIDVSVFTPSHFEPRKPARFIFVGMMLRDFETAHRVMDLCSRERLDAEFLVVLAPGGRSYFTGCTNALIRSGISESELIEAYRGCDALFLPLLDSTANNALLEAMACGVPVVSTRVGGVPDYVDESAGWLLPRSDVDAAFECLRGIIRDREIAVARRPPARARAELFAWERVAAATRAAYARLLRLGQFAPDANETSVSAAAGAPRL